MQSCVRSLATIALPLLLATLAFAGDANKPTTNPPETAANAAIVSAASEAPQASPSPAPGQKSPSPSDPARSETTPAGELFLGYSYVRFGTDSAPFPNGPAHHEHFDMIPGGIAQI